MKKFISLMVLGLFLVVGQANAQFVVAEDHAGNYGSWSNNSNEGFGFNAWSLTKQNSGGHFLENSESQGFGNLNTDNKAFAMWGNPNGDNYAHAKRYINSNILSDGVTFSIDLAIAWRNGSKGLNLYINDGNNNQQTKTFYVAHDEHKLDGSDYYSNQYDQRSVFHLTAKQDGNNVVYTVHRKHKSGENPVSKTYNNHSLTGFQLYVGSTDAGNNLNNFFFNNLKASYSDASKIPSNIKVVLEDNAEINADVEFGEFTILYGKTLTIRSGKNLKINGNFKNYGHVVLEPGATLDVNDGYLNHVDGTITLQSDATNGNATLLVNGDVEDSGTATVEQHLSDARPSWYMSLPVSTLDGNTGVSKAYIFTENAEKEGASGWSETSISGNVAPGQGVMLQPNSGVTKLSFTGALNNGDNITASPLTMESRGFHYLGNPYPSFINWDDMWGESEYVGGVQDGIWFRSHNGNSFFYQTYNGEESDYVRDDGLIAPMEGFWVRANAADAYVNFKNALRKHAPSAVAHAPSLASKAEYPVLRLAVSDGTRTDHTVVYFKETNSNGKDRKDATKLRNNNAMPEIWTVVEGEAVAINAMNSVPYNVEQTLGFHSRDGGEFSISATTFSGFAEGDDVELIDKVANRTHKLSEGAYSFTADAGSTTDRFGIMFVPGATTSVSQAGIEHVHIYSVNNQLQIKLGTTADNARATIYTVSGQQVGSMQLTSSTATIARNLSSGVYMVVIENGGERTVKRVILN